MKYRPSSSIVKSLCALAAMVCLTAAQASAALIDLTPQGNQINSANSVTFAALQADPTATIVVGDKIFTGFSYAGTNDMPPSSAINVLGFKDPAGNWGLTFQGAFLDLPGLPNSDAKIRFAVEVSPAALAQGWRISDAHLVLHGAGMGDDSFFSIIESFTDVNNQSANQSMKVQMSTLGPLTPQNPFIDLSDMIVFNQLHTKLFVTKDILAIAAASATEPSQGSVIDQSFSQEQIPEPATLVLASLSGLAMVSIARRRG